MDIEGWSVDDLRSTNDFLTLPSNTERLWTLLEAPSNMGENLGRRMKGWLMPPVTGNYSFYIASDDRGELWLSNDDNHLFLACYVPLETYNRAWTWFPHQESSPICLVAGQAIYCEVSVLILNLRCHEFLFLLTHRGIMIILSLGSHEAERRTGFLGHCMAVPGPGAAGDSGQILSNYQSLRCHTIVDLMVGTNNFENAPNRTERLSSLLEIVEDQGDNYGVRMTGWLLPPALGAICSGSHPMTQANCG